jgi:hypothetical protein
VLPNDKAGLDPALSRTKSGQPGIKYQKVLGELLMQKLCRLRALHLNEPEVV